ncbi:MAG: DUF389 domain-containing protein [Snowella sp.]|nr:DUF389 domain-containing protein [Snowella sp.]
MPLKNPFFRRLNYFRRRFAQNLGLTDARKKQIYQEICESVSLSSVSYWLQVLLAAGIATLGLVLNSPAVIIGAMLISPLMGSILASGLALAVGDVILVLRATINLILSCSLAIAFAILLVSLLPFKEMTSEIMARTQPNLLDLMVALFSGAVGSVAICQEQKGVATSLPGVAIAVALMPPLCVVGYGLGLVFSVPNSNGLQVAMGGGLLFFTNLVAIVFTAMLVFFFVHLDTKNVREQIHQWQDRDRESHKAQQILIHLPTAGYFQKIGSLPGRFLLILLTIVVISLPLNQSLGQLRQEIIRKRQENHLRTLITDTWQQQLGKLSNGEARAYINQLLITEQSENLIIQLQVVTSKFYSQTERENFIERLAQVLRRKPESITLKLVEIPTGQLVESQTPQPLALASPTITELQNQFLQAVKTSLQSITLPSPAQLITIEISPSAINPLSIQIIYLSDRDLQEDGKSLLTNQIRNQLNILQTTVVYNRVNPQIGSLKLGQEKTEITASEKVILDQAGKLLQKYPNLILSLQLSTDKTDPLLSNNLDNLRRYLAEKWQVKDSQIQEKL